MFDNVVVVYIPTLDINGMTILYHSHNARDTALVSLYILQLE